MRHAAEPSLVFSTCLFCHGALGANDAIEHFPVGKRLAFDGERGRLWAVCPRCARWNLAPIEERWEALEECEKAYRGTRQRVSTDNIALARLKDGTDLVRIGRPLLPELATWRYAGELARRRRRYRAAVGATMAVGGAASIGMVWGASAVLGVSVGFQILQFAGTAASQHYEHHRPVVRMRWPRQGPLAFSRHELITGRLACEDGRATLRLSKRLGAPSLFERIFGSSSFEYDSLACSGDEMLDVLRIVVPYYNRGGGDRLELRDAVHRVETAPSTDALLNEMATRRSVFGPLQDGSLATMPGGLRLAFEMKLNDDDERCALAGELGALYARWEDAERIARIADGELTRLPVRE
jgi:hypothetical protein